MPESAIPAYITSLIRHFEDLRTGTHGGSASRKDKETHFERAVQLLVPIARQVLSEIGHSGAFCSFRTFRICKLQILLAKRGNRSRLWPPFRINNLTESNVVILRGYFHSFLLKWLKIPNP